VSSGGELPIPPGRFGLPFIGEMPLILKDAYGFVEERARRYGPIFRTRMLGHPTAVITGPDANGKFIDADDVQRADAMPGHVQALFGGSGVLPLLDGEAHRTRKHFMMSAFTREAMIGYLPQLQRLVVESLAGWAAAGELRWLEPLERLAVEAITGPVMGISPGPTVDALVADYGRVLRGFTALPLPLPWSTYRRARRALERILAVYAATIRDHLASPRPDGLSRILAARAPGPEPHALSPDDCKRELHHIVIAGVIVWAWLMAAAVELDRHPAVRDRLAEEIARLAPAGPLTLEQLEAMPYLGLVTMEIRRLTPVVQVFFGRARRTFTFAGHRVPQGWMVLWGIRSSHIWPALYPDPLRFDPERFTPGRAEHLRHPLAFVPNGAGDVHRGHKCVGYEYAPALLQTFLVELVRGYHWSFPDDQDRSINYGRVPAAPRDGLRVRLVRRQNDSGALPSDRLPDSGRGT
jgi:cytochrome P450